MSQHTPRPWSEFEDEDSHDIIAPDGTHICRMEPRNGQPTDHAMQVADARLIAQAPAMLEMLRVLVATGFNLCKVDEDNTRAILRAVEGQ